MGNWALKFYDAKQSDKKIVAADFVLFIDASSALEFNLIFLVRFSVMRVWFFFFVFFCLWVICWKCNLPKMCHWWKLDALTHLTLLTTASWKIFKINYYLTRKKKKNFCPKWWSFVSINIKIFIKFFFILQIFSFFFLSFFLFCLFVVVIFMILMYSIVGIKTLNLSYSR